ncbi:hypothetical protein LTS18_014224 [Coniosporium uncinatum]|uniref:Uncharacterized protein n=1 Tax=Coniosporium uncinatum TaxID=93489 RepID=A0ACC3DVC6_9PEZI|nr:hypothetical protein LTS18_014224 [Coniosporium uncinatum]
MDPLPQRPETNDYYRVLGLKCNADDLEIERAFRKRSVATHPDSTNRVPDYYTFNEVAQAYRNLISPELRDAYHEEHWDYGLDDEWTRYEQYLINTTGSAAAGAESESARYFAGPRKLPYVAYGGGDHDDDDATPTNAPQNHGGEGHANRNSTMSGNVGPAEKTSFDSMAADLGKELPPSEDLSSRNSALRDRAEEQDHDDRQRRISEHKERLRRECAAEAETAAGADDSRANSADRASVEPTETAEPYPMPKYTPKASASKSAKDEAEQRFIDDTVHTRVRGSDCITSDALEEEDTMGNVVEFTMLAAGGRDKSRRPRPYGNAHQSKFAREDLRAPVEGAVVKGEGKEE